LEQKNALIKFNPAAAKLENIPINAIITEASLPKITQILKQLLPINQSTGTTTKNV
jgi:hypothetical protein